MTSKILNHLTPKVVCGSNYLVTQTYCVLVLQEPLQIMLWLENIDWDSSSMKNSNVCAKTIQLNQEDTFFMIVQGLMGTGIQEEIHSAISSCSW